MDHATRPTGPAVSLARSLSTLSTSKQMPTKEERDIVNALMQKQRDLAGNQKSGMFTIKEANPVLLQIADGCIPDATPGMILALFNSGANVSIERPKSSSLLKRFSGKDQLEVRSKVLERAAANCSAEVFAVLSPSADEQSINEALLVTMARQDAVKTSMLLVRGANATPLCKQFMELVYTGPLDIVEALLLGNKGACTTCRNEGLLHAAEAGDISTATLLLRAGGDPAFKEGKALFEIISRGLEDLAIEMALSKTMAQHPPSPILGQAASMAYTHNQLATLEACLSMDPCSPEIVGILHQAFMESRVDVVEMVARSAQTAVELLNAVATSQDDIDMGALTRQIAVRDALAFHLQEAANIYDLELSSRMVDALLSSGLRGDPVIEALALVARKQLPVQIEPQRSEILHILFSKGFADVNARNGSLVIEAAVEGQLEVLRLFLQQSVSTETISATLSQAMDMPMPALRLEVLQTIFGHNKIAIDERLQLHGLVVASMAFAMDVLQFLSSLTTLPPTYSEAFGVYTKGFDRWRTPPGLSVASFLLNHGASGQEVGEALIEAAMHYDRDAFSLLASAASPDSIDHALGSVLENTKLWALPENLWLFHYLTAWGRGGIAANKALVHLASTKPDEPGLTAVIDTLFILGKDLDCNYEKGLALQKAAQNGSISLLAKLMPKVLEPTAVNAALQAAITSSLQDNEVLAVIDVLFGKPDALNLTTDASRLPFPHDRLIIHTCLLARPRSVRVLDRLVQLGFDAKGLVELRLGDDNLRVPILFWAICQEEPKLSIEVVDILIRASAHTINFWCQISGLSPLTAAVIWSRSDVVEKLVAANVETARKDLWGKTALFHASGKGNIAMVNSILTRKPIPNDGSLHEAARNLHHQIAEALIKAKHNVSFPSDLHEGRSPLQELCHCGEANLQNIGDLELTLSTLQRGKCDWLATHKAFGDRNSLFLALENPFPFLITKALLNIIAWRQINDEKNTFTWQDPADRVTYVHSATMYLSRMHFRGLPENEEGLRRLLVEKQCEDRYYALYGPQFPDAIQPPDAVGMPEDIVTENKRRLAERQKRAMKEQDFQEKLQRERIEAEQKLGLVHQAERQKEEAKGKGHLDKMERERAEAQLKLQLEQSRTEQQLNSSRTIEMQKQAAKEKEHRDKMQREQLQAQQKLGINQAQHMQQLNSSRQTERQKQAAKEQEYRDKTQRERLQAQQKFNITQVQHRQQVVNTQTRHRQQLINNQSRHMQQMMLEEDKNQRREVQKLRKK
ncbi:hypothetical protein F5X68DRAFT_254481 [Plectosphaerella plurivora]|uniref:Ankyrin repeat protein n=1 Tax=Plectosphaerella plurivora TaxID=936078 RepID=A0A9P8VE37_9PEZI|nr:hypothetical protein F5X68DRAFT_254481 [Plectosphaerella plurivora]